MIRSRWAAIGAAVAVTLGVGGMGLVDATVSTGTRSVYVPIEPCRIMDTRPEFQVGPRGTPIGAEQTYTVPARGSSGNCTLPNDATALGLNVTAVGATLPTFLTIWGDGSRPTASSLNPTPGQPPVPNAVTTDLTDSGGRFTVFNLQGTVHVLADVVGYYVDLDQRAPRVNTVTIGSAAFTAADSDVVVIKSSPGAGAHVFEGLGGVDRLVAPLVLPDGVTVTEIVVHHFDVDDDDVLGEDLTFRLQCERLDSPGQISQRAGATSLGTVGWATVSMSGLPEVIDNGDCAYFLEAAADWDNLVDPEDLSISAFEVTYQTAG